MNADTKGRVGWKVRELVEGSEEKDLGSRGRSQSEGAGGAEEAIRGQGRIRV